MEFYSKWRVLSLVLAVFLTAGSNADAQNQPPTVPESVVPQATQSETNESKVENKTADIVVPPAPRKVERSADVTYDLLIGVAAMDNSRPGEAVQFGKFNGVTDNKIYLIGAASIQSRNGRRYWNFKADDIGLGNRNFNFDGGTMGRYKIHFGYSELDNLLSSTSQTPFNGAGGATLTLPAGFTRAFNTTAMTDLAASMKPVELGTKRKEGDARFSFEPGKNVGLFFSMRRYLKNGVKSVGTLFLDYSPLSMILPEPVNYHTDEFRTGLDWHGERGQANVEYYYSRFSNSDSSLTWDNPYTGCCIGASDQGRNSLPPDNQHQRLSLSGSFRLAATTRLSAVLERGKMTQNQEFLPYTINPASTISVPLPRGSANGRIDTTLFKLELSTQPWSALSLHAGYRHYVTDNKTPRDLFLMVINDTGPQEGVSDRGARYNQPLDYRQNQFAVDGSYYFGSGTTLKLGFDRDHKDYDYRNVNSTREDSYSAKLNKRWDAATAFVNVAYGRKRPDSYDQARDFSHSHTSQYLVGNTFDNLPGLRQFDVAERDRWRHGLGVTLQPRQDLTLGLNANRNRDQYNDSQFGLQAQKTDNVTVDATLTPDEFQTWSLYYTRQNLTRRQASRVYWSPGQAANAVNDWSAQHRDAIDTVGVNITFSFMDDALPVRLGYAYANINTDSSFTADPASTLNTPTIDMPTLKAERHTMDLSGTYSVRDNLSVRLGAMVEFYKTKDWATDGYPPGSSTDPSLLTLSGSATPYRVILVSTALNYQF